MTPLPGDMTSLSLAVKMQSSKRTLRSHEIPITQNLSGSQLGNNVTSSGGGSGASGTGAVQQQHQQQGNNQMNSMGGGSSGASGSGSGPGGGGGQINSSHSNNGGLGIGGGGNSNSSSGCNLGNMNNIMGGMNSMPLAETELDLHFSLQYPHFIKRDGNR